jgi:hypothetical protein
MCTPWIAANINMLTPICLRLYNRGRYALLSLANGPIIRIKCKSTTATKELVLMIRVSTVMSGSMTICNPIKKEISNKIPSQST